MAIEKIDCGCALHTGEDTASGLVWSWGFCRLHDAAADLLGELRGLCDIASTADLPRGVRDAAHRARLIVERAAPVDVAGFHRAN